MVHRELEKLFAQKAKIDGKIAKLQAKKRKKITHKQKPKVRQKKESFIGRFLRQRREKQREERFARANAVKRLRESNLPEEKKAEQIEFVRTEGFND